MNHLKKRIIILLLLFIAAIAVYFFLSKNPKNEQNGVLYTTMEEPSLPVVMIDTCEKSMNCMRGYLDERDSSDVAADTLTILPENRQLSVHINDSAFQILKIRYEIRSADLSELIEQTEVSNSVKTDRGIDVTLPVQNLISAGREYRLELILTTESKGDIRYYTRIAFDEKGNAAKMVELADSFSRKNFDYDAARDNTTYLETDASGDNTTLGHVTLKSNYSQLTYGSLHLSPVGERDVRLTEYNGSMGIVKIDFTAASDGENGSQDLYEISESISMRVGPERLYMMDYTRTMHEVFMGNADQFSEAGILLGISERADVQSIKSSSGNYTAFVSARDLWMMDSNGNSCIKVYSFRSGTDSGLRSNYTKHGIKALSLDDAGNMEFLLYGYMSRGNHEGETGIALMKYDAEKNSVIEQTFISSGSSFEEIEQDVKTLSYLGTNSMLYLKIGNSFYGMDTTSNESILIAKNLHAGNYSVSRTGNRIAWQDTEDGSGSSVIHFMNLDNAEKKELKCESGKLQKPIGFENQDLVVGVAEEKNGWNINGTDRGIPFTSIEIVDDDLNSQKHYEKEGNYLTQVTIDGSRIHVKLLSRTGDHTFANAGEDTIVCNIAEEEDTSVVTAKDETRETIYQVPVSRKIRDRSVKISTPGSIDTANSNSVNPVNGSSGEKVYYAWGHGKMIGVFESFGDAINAAYAEMGYVRSKGSLVYCRAATSGLRNLKNPDAAAVTLLEMRSKGKLSDLYGVSLKEVLYFVSRGMIVLGYTDAGDPILIYAYDRAEVSLYEVNSGQYRTMQVDEAETMFDNGHNDFSCDFTLQG